MSPPESESGSDALAGVLGAEEGGAFRRFLEWSMGHGFKLAIVEMSLPRQVDALVNWTTARYPEARPVRLDEVGSRSLEEALGEACASPTESSLLILTRLEQSKDRKKLCAQLNVQRDALVEGWRIPWVFLVHPSASLDLQRDAPDFADFAGLWLRAPLADAQARQKTELQIGLTSHLENSSELDLLDQAERAFSRSRLDEMRDLLGRFDLRGPHSPLIAARRSFLESDLLEKQGDVDQALRILNQALLVFREAGNTRLQAITMGRIADIYFARGDLDEALRIRCEEDEKLGDPID